MKSKFPFNRLRSVLPSLFFFLFIIHPALKAQISVPGIDGLPLAKSDASYTKALTGKFNLHDMVVNPTSLQISWDKGKDEFSITGTATVRLKDEDLIVSFGDTLPGLIIKGDTLNYVNLNVTSSFLLKGITITPLGLGMAWSRNENSYGIYGAMKVKFETDSIERATLGTTQDPGIRIVNGEVKHISIGVTGGFKLKSLELIPDNLTFSYDMAGEAYKLYGSVRTKIESDSLDALLGDSINPGIRISKGVVEHINIGVTTEFTLKSLRVKPVGLTFEYDKQKQDYIMYGFVRAKIESDSLDAILGNNLNPGIRIRKGSIEHINMGVTAHFKLKWLELMPDKLTFCYDKTKSAYQLYGSLQVKVESDSLKATLGDSINPGIRIGNGIIEHINIGVTADFTLKTLQIKPVGLTFEYDRQKQYYLMYGLIKTRIESDSLTASLGSKALPGLVIDQYGLNKIEMDITSDLKLKGLHIRTDSLGFAWVRKSDEFHLYGKADIEIKSDTIGFSFGGKNNPGLVYKNKQIQYLRFTTNADLHFGGMHAGSKDFTIEYHNSEYHAYGKLFVTEVWRASIDLGTQPGSGVTLHFVNNRPEFRIDKATFALGNVDLGSFKVKDMQMTLKNNEMTEIDAKLEFKPGWTVESDLIFASYKLTSVEINWQAASIKQALAIPGTGAFIMSMDGKLENFKKPHDFKFTGKMGIFVGPEFKAGNMDASFAYLDANATMNRNELIIKDDAYIGAYLHNGKWESVFGRGNMTLDLKWGSSYTLKGKLNIPSNNTIIATSLNARLGKSGAFNSLMDVSLIVPKSIPIIGGHKFGSADGAIHYKANENDNFIAGWVKIHLVFKTLQTGVKYNFKNSSFSHIGSGSISDIKKIVKVAPPAASTTSRMKAGNGNPPPLYWDKLKISVDEGIMPHYIQVRLKLKHRMDSVFTRVTTPAMNSNQSYAACYYVNAVDSLNDQNVDIKMLSTHHYLWSKNKDEITFFILPVGYDTEIGSRLAAGDYWLEVANTTSAGIVDIDSVQVSKLFEKPRIDSQKITTTYAGRISDSNSTNSLVEDLSVNIKLLTETSNPDSTEVHLLCSRDGNDGMIAYSGFYKDLENAENQFIHTVTLPDEPNPNDSLFAWAIIDDKINPVVTTERVRLDYKFPFIGKIRVVNQPDSVAAGIGIDIQLLGNDNEWYSINEGKVNHTAVNGEFGFTQQVASGTQIRLKIDIPYGFEVDEATVTKPNTTCTVGPTKGYDFGIIYLKEISK